MPDDKTQHEIAQDLARSAQSNVKSLSLQLGELENQTRGGKLTKAQIKSIQELAKSAQSTADTLDGNLDDLIDRVDGLTPPHPSDFLTEPLTKAVERLKLRRMNHVYHSPEEGDIQTVIDEMDQILNG